MKVCLHMLSKNESCCVYEPWLPDQALPLFLIDPLDMCLVLLLLTSLCDMLRAACAIPTIFQGGFYRLACFASEAIPATTHFRFTFNSNKTFAPLVMSHFVFSAGTIGWPIFDKPVFINKKALHRVEPT